MRACLCVGGWVKRSMPDQFVHACFFFNCFNWNDHGIKKKMLLTTAAVKITILSKKGDGIFDAVKMDLFF